MPTVLEPQLVHSEFCSLLQTTQLNYQDFGCMRRMRRFRWTTLVEEINGEVIFVIVYLHLLCFVLFVLCFCIVWFMYIYSYLFCVY